MSGLRCLTRNLGLRSNLVSSRSASRQIGGRNAIMRSFHGGRRGGEGDDQPNMSSRKILNDIVSGKAKFSEIDTSSRGVSAASLHSLNNLVSTRPTKIYSTSRLYGTFAGSQIDILYELQPSQIYENKICSAGGREFTDFQQALDCFEKLQTSLQCTKADEATKQTNLHALGRVASLVEDTKRRIIQQKIVTAFINSLQVRRVSHPDDFLLTEFRDNSGNLPEEFTSSVCQKELDAYNSAFEAYTIFHNLSQTRAWEPYCFKSQQQILRELKRDLVQAAAFNAYRRDYLFKKVVSERWGDIDESFFVVDDLLDASFVVVDETEIERRLELASEYISLFT